MVPEKVTDILECSEMSDPLRLPAVNAAMMSYLILKGHLMLTPLEIVTFTDPPAPDGADPVVGHRRDGPIEIADYDPAWPDLAVEFIDRIRSALGTRAINLEHVGSTSVPGLPAKPIIDIDLTVADPSREEAWLPPLEQAGFALAIREPWWHEHRVVVANGPAANVHVFPPGCPELYRHRVFRDWLRANPDDRARYMEIKTRSAEAASARGETVMQYNDRKSAVIREIYGRAFRAAGLLD